MKEKSQSGSALTSYAWVILVVVYFAGVVAPFSQFKVPPIMPILMQKFQLDLTQAGLLMSSFAAVGLVLALPAGLALQRFGSRKTIVSALGFLALGGVLGALSQNFTLLLGSRVLEGVGMGLIGVAAPATIAMWFPPEKRGTPMGIWATWVPVGSVAIYNLAPALAAPFGWQAVWWLGTAFALIMMILAGLLISNPAASEAADAQAQPAPQLKKALANRNIWLLALSFACMNVVIVCIATFYPTFLGEVRGYPLGQAAGISSIVTLMSLVSSPLAGWLSDKLGSRRLLFSYPYLAIGLMLAFPFLVKDWQIIAVMAVLGLLIGFIPSVTFAAAPELMGSHQLAGLGLAVILVGQNAGQLVGPLMFGAVVQNYGWAMAGYMMIPICVLGFFSGWLVKIR